jgi:hypothetical protein
MAIQYIGTTISGIASDTKPTPTANEKGVIFIETDTNKMYQWDTDSWNQVITSTDVAVGALNSGSITSGFTSIDVGSGAITTTGTITAGNLTVNGTTTTVGSTNTIITDRLIELANGAGSSTADAGIIVERGSTGDNAVIAWDESADTWTLGTTTATGASTGDLSITAGTLVANLTGNVTGNTSGTAATVTTAAQGSITSLGTLTALQVDNLNINLNTITATSGAVNITPAAGSAIVLDGTISIDAGVVTGATSITSTAFVGALTGDVTGTADTATVATTVTITDNESTNESNAIIFTAGGDVDGGNLGLESDGTLTYNPSSGTVTATVFAGNIDAVDGDFDGTLEADALTIGGTNVVSGSLITTLGTVSAGVWNGTAITGAYINDDIISGQTEITSGLATADELLYSDGGTVKKIGLDNFIELAPTLATEDAVADGDYILFLDGGASGNMNKEAVHDLATLFAGAGMTATSSVVNVIGGDGITANANDVAITAAQTTVTSVYNASLKMGRDSDNLIDFATADNKIILRANGVDEVQLVENALSPVTASGVDLGTAALEWGNIYIGDDKKIYFGTDSNATIEYDEDGTDQLRIAGNTIFEDQVELTKDLLLDSTPADPAYSGITAKFTAGEILEAGEVVYLKAADTRMWKAVSVVSGTGLITPDIMCVAMAAEDISAGASGVFLLQGFLQDNTNFPTYAIGETLYVPEAEQGGQNVPHGTIPTTDGDMIQVIGWASDANTVYFNPDFTIIEHA